MVTKKGKNKKGGFSLAPITLSEPIKPTDGFTNLVDNAGAKDEKADQPPKGLSQNFEAEKTWVKTEIANKQNPPKKTAKSAETETQFEKKIEEEKIETPENPAKELRLTETELLKILDADSFDEIYELTDVLRASSLKLYATLIQLADSRGRARAKNHELMSKAGIKGIATLYKQERWLMDLKLLEKKAKPGPHDGSSYVVRKLETLPLPAEIIEKFNQFLLDKNS